MSDDIVVKVLVDYQELKALRDFRGAHSSCSAQQTLEKEGLGDIGPGGDNRCDHSYCVQQIISDGDVSDQRAPVNVPKDIVVEKEPEISYVNSAKSQLSDSIIINSVWKKYQSRAKSLLQALKSHSDVICYDENGILILNGKIQAGKNEINYLLFLFFSLFNSCFLGSNVLELIPATFYKRGKEPVTGFKPWIDTLKELNLQPFIRSLHDQSQSKSETNDPYWYFIGELT